MLGELYLYDKDDNVVNYKAYYSVRERKDIMERWMVAKKRSDYITIYPHHNSKQPQAVYSNLTVYDYGKQKNGHGN